MQDFEKLGVFYLGKIFDVAKQKATEDLFLYESKNLTTHAVCIGMTGSGKTGLGIALLEEAAIDKIPSIIIDPKGDLGNLLLTFPDLSPEEFRPWIDPAEAERKGMSVEEYSKTVAKTWKDGLEKSGEGPDRIKKLRQSVEMAIYTPASKAGIPISILSSFSAPTKEMLLDTAAMRDRVMSTTSSLLGLLGINADPIKSREHILISTLINDTWQKGQDVSIDSLIQQVQKPPFTKIGALDIDTVFPPKDRTALAVTLNNLLASPGFQAWMEGEPLDIDQLLYTPDGKPKLSILSIAHLSDTERMFFVTLLLNQLLSWMRRQPGTSSLRALFYMDEVFGYFPPTAMPPSKLPLLTMLKQARAFGLGIVLATQNPVDLDYKGLSNCGTWFIGKLQTDRDKARVIEGLNAASNGELSSAKLDKMMASITARVFMLRSIYEKEPILFQTRWTMSYLRGPLTLAQIKTLSKDFAPEEEKETAKAAPKARTKAAQPSASSSKPNVPSGVNEYFINGGNHYKPFIAGRAKMHYVDSKSKTDVWEDVNLFAPPNSDGKSVDWSKSEDLLELKGKLRDSPEPDSSFGDLPSALMQEKNYANLSKDFATWLYQSQSLSAYQYSPLNMASNSGENEQEFRQRVSLALREKRDDAAKKLREKYSQKISALESRLRRSEDKLEQKQNQSWSQKVGAWTSVGATIIGSLLGKGLTKGTITQAGTSMRRVAKIGQDSQQVQRVDEDRKALEEQLQDVQKQLNDELAQIAPVTEAAALNISTVKIAPRKSDISVNEIALLWYPD